MVAPDSLWHINRRKEVLKKKPELKGLDGVFYGSAPCIVVLVALQWYIWTVVNEFESYILIGFCAWLNATTLFYSLSTFIHENSHGLIFGWKNRLAAACLIEAAFCSFGEQWEYTVVHYSMHHPQLNDQEKDSECPAEGHVAVQPTNFMKYLVPWIELLPIGTLLTQGQLSNNAQHSSTQNMQTPQNVLIGVSLAVYGVLAYNRMWHAMLFAAWTTSLYASRWCIALHGQSISEHYRHNFEPKPDVPPTHSTYHFLENFIGFNTGYHDEHHTFPNVAWYHLPKLKKEAPDVFTNVNTKRYTELWYEWAVNGFETSRFRMCHG
jgi:sphingolipid delta-4 desaturase